MLKISRKTLRSETGAILIIEVALLAAVLVVAGFVVYNAQQAKRKATNTVLRSSPKASTSPASTTKYLVIKEMGIRLPLSAEIYDLTYYYDARNKTAALSSMALSEKTKGACAAGPGVGPLETIHRTKELPKGYPSQGVKQINGYYIWRTPPQAVCSTVVEAEALATKQRAAVHNAVDAAEPTNDEAAPDSVFGASVPSDFAEFILAEYDKYQSTCRTQATFSVYRVVRDSYAGVNENCGAGAAVFYAKVDGVWVKAFSTQNVPPCSEVNKYKFTKELVSECWGPGNKLTANTNP